MPFSEIEVTTLRECVRLLNRGGWSVRQCRAETVHPLVGQAVLAAEVAYDEVHSSVSLALRLSNGETSTVPVALRYPNVTVRLIDGQPTAIKVHGMIECRELAPLSVTVARPLRSSSSEKPFMCPNPSGEPPTPAQRVRTVTGRGNVITFIHRANFDRAQAPYKPSS